MATNKSIKIQASQVDGYKIEAKARDFTMYIDQPEAMGGQNSGPNPLEYNLVSFAACCITIGHIIARQKRLKVRGLSTEIEGALNTEVFMGKNGNTDRAGFQEISVKLIIDADMSPEEKQAYAEEISARCPVAENLINLTPVKLIVN